MSDTPLMDELRRLLECSWPECGCDPSGVESPPCRAQHENEHKEEIVDKTSTAAAEFEMLVNVLIAHKRVLDAVGWCEKKDSERLAHLNTACTALLKLKKMCSEENQRLADMQVYG